MEPPGLCIGFPAVFLGAVWGLERTPGANPVSLPAWFEQSAHGLTSFETYQHSPAQSTGQEGSLDASSRFHSLTHST